VPFIVWRFDIAETWRQLRSVNLLWASLGLALFTASTWIEGYRWLLLLLRRADLKQYPVILVYIVSRLANVLMPLRGGDLVRIQIANRRFGIPRSELAASIFAVETPLNWLTFVLGLTFSAYVLHTGGIGGTFVSSVPLIFLGGFGAAVLLSRSGHDLHLATRPPFRWLPESIRHIVAEHVGRFVAGMETFRKPMLALRAIGVSVLNAAVQVLMFWSLGKAFGLDLTVLEYIPVMLGPTLVRTLQLTPGDLGPYEVVMGQIVVVLGVDAGTAGAFAVGSHLLILAWTAVLGLLSIWLLNLKVHDLFGRHPSMLEGPPIVGPAPSPLPPAAGTPAARRN
jgi:uncharacterized protein (TIRG00374 family)